jgi:hypothetical protein
MRIQLDDAGFNGLLRDNGAPMCRDSRGQRFDEFRVIGKKTDGKGKNKYVPFYL